MVNALTKNMEITPRSARNANAIVQAINGPKETILVKMCDRLANLLQFRGLTLEFLEHTYLPETEALVCAFEPHVGDYTDAYTALVARMRNVKAIFPSESIR